MKAAISVVMAIRDAEATLEGALSSLQNQTLSPEEILLVLNGCSDGSSEIAARYAAMDNRIRILDSPALGGVAAAAQLGCQQATSPLLARMDADDICDQNRLALQAATLSQMGADLATCVVQPLNSQGEGLDRYIDWANSLQAPADFRRERFVESPIIQPGVLMTRESYLAAGGYRVQSGAEDYDLWLRMLERGARCYQAPGALVQWRDSPTRLTRSHPDYSAMEMTTTKARYLARLAQVQARGVAVAGSGPIGRRLVKLLRQQEVVVRGFFDVAPKKIGQRVLDLPVWGPDEMGSLVDEVVLLGCVGRGGRSKVRAMAKGAGYHEGENFFACC